jgi:hypothetical protein
MIDKKYPSKVRFIELDKVDDATLNKYDEILPLKNDDYPLRGEKVVFVRNDMYADAGDVQLFDDPITGETIEQAYVLPTARVRQNIIHPSRPFASRDRKSIFRRSQMKNISRSWPSRLNLWLIGFVIRRRTTSPV